MDTEAFLLERQALQAHMMDLRLAAGLRKRSAWRYGLSLLPLAGLLLARRAKPSAHPLVHHFALAGVGRMFSSLARRWGLARVISPVLAKNFLSFAS